MRTEFPQRRGDEKQMHRHTKTVAGVAGLALAGVALAPVMASAQGGSSSPSRSQSSATSAVPGLGGVALPAPEGARLVDAVRGDGVQVYECIANADGSGTWRNRPVATLRGLRASRTVGTHDSVTRTRVSPVPQWSYLDGSRVIAQLPPLVNQPDTDPAANITALRLAVAENSGIGRLAGVTLIQRDLVAGGVGPAGACAVGTDAPVVSPYSTRYTFWAPRS